MPTINEILSNLMWVGKYRPLTLDEVVDQKEIVNALRQLINIPDDELSHLLFAAIHTDLIFFQNSSLIQLF
jgi:hypothetical protein